MIQFERVFISIIIGLVPFNLNAETTSNSCLPSSEKWDDSAVNDAIKCLDSRLQSLQVDYTEAQDAKGNRVVKNGIEIELRKAVVINNTADKKNQFVEVTFTVTNKNKTLLSAVLQGEPPTALDDNMSTFAVNLPDQIKHLAVCHNFYRDSARRPRFRITNESKGEFCETKITQNSLVPTFLKYDSPQLLKLNFQPEAVDKVVKGDRFEFVKFNLLVKNGDEFSPITYTFENIDIQPKAI